MHKKDSCDRKYIIVHFIVKLLHEFSFFPFLCYWYVSFFFFRISSLPSDKASHLLILVHLINILLEYKKNLGLLY